MGKAFYDTVESVKNLYDASLDEMPYRFITYVVFCLLMEALIAYFVAKRISEKENEIGVIIQGSFRSNFAYVGIPLATMFFTDAGQIQLLTSEISLLSIVIIPILNVMAISILTRYSDQQTGKDHLWKKIFNGIIRNPCIISVFLGIFVLLFRAAVPTSAFFVRDRLSFLYKIVSYCASMATPFAWVPALMI